MCIPAPTGTIDFVLGSRRHSREETHIMKKILGWTVAGIVSIGGFAACGSDEDKSPDTTAASTATTAGGTEETTATGETTAGSVAEGGESSAEVEQFCADAEDLVERIKNADTADLATLQADATQFTTDAASITANATPEETARIQECLGELTTALTGG
jgi:hypothetical protein